jgi:riboflavin transporter FmnP
MENRMKLKKMLYTVSLASVATVLGIFEIPMFLPFLKIDLSEVVVLVALIVIGYKGAFSIVLIRSFFRPIILGNMLLSTYMGELIAIIASLVLITTYILVNKLLKVSTKPLIYEIGIDKPKVTMKEYFATMGAMILALTLFMAIFNFFIGVPLYGSIFLFEFVGNTQIHFHIFSFVKDPMMLGVVQQIGFKYESLTLSNMVLFILIGFSPLNISKAITTALIVLLIKPRLQYLEL